MPKFYQKKRNAKRYSRRPRSGIARKTVRKVKRSVFRKRVKKVVQSMAETKHISTRGTKVFSTLRASSSGYSENFFILTPASPAVASAYGGIAVGIGSGDGQREGNKISLKKGMFNVAINVQPYNATTNPVPQPQILKLFFFRTKVNQQTLPQVGDICGSAGTFFQDGTGTTALIGNLADLNMLINTDRYTYVASRTIKLGYQQYGGSGGNIGAQWWGNNDYKMNYVNIINITKMLPKTFTWDDQGNATTPYLFCLAQTVNSDGSTADPNYDTIQCVYEQYMEYTDL